LFLSRSLAQQKSIDAVPQKIAINLDGRLDDTDWANATKVALTQQSPRPGGPSPYPTEVLVLASPDALYFGFRCLDPNPERIAVHTMRRDGVTTGDDTVSIALDTYGDRRTGYYFQINAAAARIDGLISDPESASLDWDGIWEARTHVDQHGWTAEILIPARTLSFSRQASSWGVNFERFIPRDRVTMRWSSPTLDSFFYDLSRTGNLNGVSNLEQGHGVEISPYGTARTKEFFQQSPRAYQGSIGGDVSWRITPQLTSVVTINTDFAETEVDARQINTTRFPLFFPEKRAFFLEGANQFQFGLGLQEVFIPFFSRRVGLFQGSPIPIDAGAKINGRIGNLNVAFLDVKTRDTDTPFGPVPGTNLLASRVSYDVTSTFRIGGLITNGNPDGTSSNTFGGVDAVYRTSTFTGNKNFLVGAWTGRASSDLGSGSPQGWGYKIDYPNDLWDCAHTLNHFGRALDPALGFLPRPGTQRLTVGCNWQPRPSKDGAFKWVRQEFWENQFTRYTNADGFLESWEFFMAPVNVRMETGDRFEFNWIPTYEFLSQPFEIVAGRVIPPGRYQFTRWRLEAQTSPHRPFQFGHTTWFGTFFDGHLTQWENYAKWTSPKGKLQLELSTEQNFGHLDSGNFVQRLWQLQSAYAWNPDLILTSFIQYDSESKNIGTNTRLRWTLKPGNDLFLIWNRGWQKVIRDPHELNLVPESELIAIKLRWTVRR
jgi:hypothetical protein